MALRAVIFDLGMVLTGPPDPQAYAQLLRISGLTPEQLDPLYWADRHAYDEGKLNGVTFWQKVTSDAGLSLKRPVIEELSLWDARMWTTPNNAMVAWQQALKEHGLKTAVLSNIGDDVRANIEREFKWLAGFDVLVWSYLLKTAKPDPAIYHYTLQKLDVAPEEALFVDDREVNIEAARALGMQGLVFTDAAKLRADLIATGLAKQLPLPDGEAQ